MRFAGKITLAALAVDLAAAGLYVGTLGIIYGPFVNLSTILALAAGLLAVVLVPCAFVAGRWARPFDLAVAERRRSGMLGPDAALAVDEAHVRLSWFPLTIQTAAVFVAFAIGESLFESNPLIILKLPFWREYVNVLGAFLLGAAIQSLLFNYLIARVRESLGIKTLSGRRRFGILPRVMPCSLALVVWSIASAVAIAQIGVSEIYVEQGIATTRLAYAALPGDEAKLKAALWMTAGMDDFAQRMVEYTAAEKRELAKGLEGMDPGYLDGFFVKTHVKSPMMAAIEAKSDDLVRRLLLFLCLDLPFAFALLFLVSRQIAQPFGLLRKVSSNQAVSSSRLPITGIDEVAELTGSINAVLERQNHQLLEMSRIASEVEASAAALASTVAAVGERAQGIGQAADASFRATARQRKATSDAREGFDEIAASVRQVSAEAEAQGAAIAELSRQIEAIRAGIGDTRSQTARNVALSDRLSDAAMQGARSVRSSAQAISAIQEASSEAEEVVRAVSDIAEKTNLLAMNASIEAAHAGALGKGFGVIAGEVRALASSSRERSSEILASIGGIARLVGEAARLSAAAESSFAVVADGIAETRALARDADETANAQARAADGMSGTAEALVERARALASVVGRQEASAASFAEAAKGLDETAEELCAAAAAQDGSSRAIEKAVSRLGEVAASNNAAVSSLNALAVRASSPGRGA